MNPEAQNLSFPRNVPPTLEQVLAYFNSLHVPSAGAGKAIVLSNQFMEDFEKILKLDSEIRSLNKH